MMIPPRRDIDESDVYDTNYEGTIMTNRQNKHGVLASTPKFVCESTLIAYEHIIETYIAEKQELIQKIAHLEQLNAEFWEDNKRADESTAQFIDDITKEKLQQMANISHLEQLNAELSENNKRVYEYFTKELQVVEKQQLMAKISHLEQLWENRKHEGTMCASSTTQYPDSASLAHTQNGRDVYSGPYLITDAPIFEPTPRVDYGPMLITDDPSLIDTYSECDKTIDCESYQDTLVESDMEYQDTLVDSDME